MWCLRASQFDVPFLSWQKLTSDQKIPMTVVLPQSKIAHVRGNGFKGELGIDLSGALVNELRKSQRTAVRYGPTWACLTSAMAALAKNVRNQLCMASGLRAGGRLSRSQRACVLLVSECRWYAP